MKLQNQTALITGASSGIGRGVALAMGKAGANVLVNFHSDESGAREVVEQIESAGGRAIAVGADVSQEADVQQMFRQAVEEFGTVDIVVSNSGIQKDAPLHDMSLEDWQAVISVNLTGGFLTAREAVREFRRRGPRPEVSKALGKIIFISSVHDIIPWAGHVNYAASKGGIMLLMRSIAQEYGREKIRVNSISPGAIRTDINESVWSDEAEARKLLKLIPYNRIGDPEDVAELALWLASDHSDYIHGETIYIDGGMTLYPGFTHSG